MDDTVYDALKVVHDYYRNLYELQRHGDIDPKLCRLYEDICRELRNREAS